MMTITQILIILNNTEIYMSDKNNDTFTYSYSAKQQKEIDTIRSKYMPAQTDTLDLIRSMDKKVTDRATAASLSTGVIGALILGTGMSCCMVWNKVMLGIIIGIIGIILVAISYPLYKSILKKERARIAPEMIRLTDELSNKKTGSQ